MLTFLTFCILILSIVVHEVAHGYAADALGDPTARLSGRLTLNPIPHIDLMGSLIIPGFLMLTGSPIFFGWAKPVPYNPYNLTNKRWGEFFVAIAGSATNLSLALFFGLLTRFGAGMGLDATALTLAASITFINLFLGLFNAIPFPPLDGFTAVRAALPWHLAAQMNQFEHTIRTMGIVSLVVFLVLFSTFFAGPFSMAVIWIFEFLTGSTV